jgi:hypothetical protein
MFNIIRQNSFLSSKHYINNKTRLNPRINMSFLKTTGCPITIFILQNKPNFPHFWPKSKDLPKKQTQNKPKQTQLWATWAVRAICDLNNLCNDQKYLC